MLMQFENKDTSPTGSLTRITLHSEDLMDRAPLLLVPLPTPILAAMRTTIVAAFYRPARLKTMAMP